MACRSLNAAFTLFCLCIASICGPTYGMDFVLETRPTLPSAERTAEKRAESPADDTSIFDLLVNDQWIVHFGVLTSTTQRLSGDLGFLWFAVPQEGKVGQWGPEVRAEFGTGGLKAKVGVGKAGLIPHSAPWLIYLDATLFWTRFDPVGLQENQTYLGLELDVGIVAPGLIPRLQLGLLQRIHGDADRHDFLVTVGFGLGV